MHQILLKTIVLSLTRFVMSIASLDTVTSCICSVLLRAFICMIEMHVRAGDTAAAGSRAKPAKAYERLHNLSIRRRVEDVNLPAPQNTPFSSFPASPPHTRGTGQRIL